MHRRSSQLPGSLRREVHHEQLVETVRQMRVHEMLSVGREMASEVSSERGFGFQQWKRHASIEGDVLVIRRAILKDTHDHEMVIARPTCLCHPNLGITPQFKPPPVRCAVKFEDPECRLAESIAAD